MFSNILENTILFVKKEIEKNDTSHDWFHIERVWKLSKKIAKEEKMEDTEIIELAALLHDIKDWKYSTYENENIEIIKNFLITQHYELEKIEKIISIIEGISFKNELEKSNSPYFKELSIVQDADRLDAIGAIGIGRTFAYSGAKGRLMFDPNKSPKENLTKEEYIKQHKENDSTTINHFYEKLLKLKDMMKTETGKKIAEKRHEFMIQFLKQFYDEWNGKC